MENILGLVALACGLIVGLGAIGASNYEIGRASCRERV